MMFMRRIFDVVHEKDDDDDNTYAGDALGPLGPMQGVRGAQPTSGTHLGPLQQRCS